jgi:hypothetical protein
MNPPRRSIAVTSQCSRKPVFSWHGIAWSLVPILMLLGSGLAMAQVRGEISSKRFTQGEWALMPEWCIDSQQGPFGSPNFSRSKLGDNGSPRIDKWLSLMGHDFWHMHHYCRGLRDVLRLKRSDLSALERKLLQDRAVDEFEYIERNTKPTMPLLPEVLLHKGEVLLQANRLGEASFAFERSRTLRPDYWPAYDRWIVVLRELKQHGQALALTQEGLAHAPDQPVLKAHLAALKIAGALPARTAPMAATEPASQAAAGPR